MRTLRTITILLALILFLAPSAAVPAQTPVRVFVDGDQVIFDQPPVTIGGRVLVPLRGIFEKMGATVVWVPATRTVRAQRGTTSVELQIGSTSARVDGRTVVLDVPAQIVGGRTLVPLRFVSEALGAGVEYNAASRTVLITTAGGAPPPPGDQTIRGVLIAVSTGSDPPTITVESGSVAHRIRITADTIITRVDASSGAGGSVSLTSLRRGDDAEVTLRDNTATRVRATYVRASGRIEAIAKASRTLVLSDGRSFRYVSDVIVLINDRPASNGADALAVGQTVELRANPTTREVWEANVLSGAGPPPPGQMVLNITRPVAGETVSSPVRVTGTTVAGARVEITVAYQGDGVGKQTVTADASGRFDTAVSFTVRVRNATYLVIVKASHERFGRAEKRVSVTAR